MARREKGERKGVVRRGCGWVEVVDLIQPFMGGNCELLPRLNCGGGGMNVIYGQTQPPPQTGQHFCIYEKLKHPSKSSLVDAKDFFLLLSASFSRSSKSRLFSPPRPSTLQSPHSFSKEHKIDPNEPFIALSLYFRAAAALSESIESFKKC